jgi:hypothetical protein
LHVTQAISFQRLVWLMAEVFGVTISEGAIANLLARAQAPLVGAAQPLGASGAHKPGGRLRRDFRACRRRPPAECILLTAIRRRVDSYEDPMPGLCQGLETAGTCDAAFSIDTLMATIARTVQQRITIHCPRCPHLSDDERHLLHAASLAQAGDGHLAEKALRSALSRRKAPNSRSVPCGDWGELFAEAGLFFRRRRPPVTDEASSAAVKPWLPSTLPATIH